MIRRRLPVFACLLASLTAVALTACVPSAPPAAPPSAEVTVLLGAGSYDLDPYSPVLAQRQLGRLVFRGLTRPGPDGRPQPDLLTELPTSDNGRIRDGGRRIDLELREDARWHDGKSVTADDVAFTLGLLRDGVLVDQPALGYADIVDVSITGTRSLTVTLRRPNSALVWGMVPYVLPGHLLEGSRDTAANRYWFAPVGSGPYRVVSSVPGREARLEPAERGGGLPLRVVFTRSQEDAGRIYEAADRAVWVDGPSQAASSLESVVSTASSTWRAYVFRVSPGSLGADADVRSAVMALLPHEATSSVPPLDPFGLALAPRSLESTPQIARSLQHAGWLAGRDGLLRKGGRELAITTVTRTILSEELSRFESLARDFGGIGITFRTYVLERLDVGGYLDRDGLTTGRYDLARTRLYFGWPLGAAWPFASGDGPTWDAPYAANVFGVKDARLDRAYAGVLNAGSPEVAEKAWQEAGRRLRELGIVHWEYPEPNRVLVKGVTGVEPHREAAEVLGAAARWKPRAADGR